ncbi:hypothetical protein E5676_scaffold1142G00250 [Cucumis melo var. makuwa]|uniref:Reverse transcriptase Ty1/copia-type domain-containing protein n=1 Tax=Cucumis melo var. makuwa TaxID=1194695 RepID=A0A5A7UI61_CUCMM|nr:hypothetical protein E6C27_scaffold406G00300 [Cucumis melo var. makuwa]TYK27764.1 hypothetical protein E5676_scaffold1142G00250 [Cucumis melo var. makuwa]
MVQPEGFIQKDPKQKVCKLQKSIYGLKQASRSWNIRFDTAIKSYGFEQNVDEPCVYKRIIKSTVAFLVLYGIHLSKEECPKTPQEVEDMSNIPYASAIEPDVYNVIKSTSGSVFTLNGGAVVWRSIKQSSIVDSTMEAEYVAACKAAKELQIHENLEVIDVESTLNKSTILSRKSYIEETLE